MVGFVLSVPFIAIALAVQLRKAFKKSVGGGLLAVLVTALALIVLAYAIGRFAGIALV